MMKASNKQESIPKATVVFIHFLIYQDERTCINSNKLNIVKCESLRINMFRITTHGKVSKFSRNTILAIT